MFYGWVCILWIFLLDLLLGLVGELLEKFGEIWESICDRLVLYLWRLVMFLFVLYYGNGDLL